MINYTNKLAALQERPRFYEQKVIRTTLPAKKFFCNNLQILVKHINTSRRKINPLAGHKNFSDTQKISELKKGRA